jgi:hypothetical protein
MSAGIASGRITLHTFGSRIYRIHPGISIHRF